MSELENSTDPDELFIPEDEQEEFEEDELPEDQPETKKIKHRRLTGEQKVFVIVRFACFCESKEVQKDFEERFGIKLSPAHLACYNYGLSTDHLRGTKVSQQYRRLFKETREQYQNAVSSIPIANQTYRLRRQQTALEKCTVLYDVNKDKAPRIVMDIIKLEQDILKQAAEETGGMYTNKRDITTNGQSVQAIIGYNITPPAIAQPLPSIEGSALSYGNVIDAEVIVNQPLNTNVAIDSEEIDSPFIEE